MTSGKQKKRLKTISWLMILSQAMLLLFVAEWIRSQYRMEEKRLHEDLLNIFSRTEEQLTNDTLDKAVAIMLAQQPDTSTRRHLKVVYHTDSPIKLNIPDSIEDTNSIPFPQSPDRMPDKEPDQDILIKHINVQANSKIQQQNIPDVLKKVLRITIQQVIDDKETWNANFIPPIDSSTLRKAFIKNLKKKQFYFKTDWDTAQNHNQQLFSYWYTGSTTALRISGYNSYLLQLLLPQTGFSVILLMLTGIAFVLAYRNMSRQRKFSEQKDSFISNISHELKTPVATTRVALEALSTYNAIEDPVRSRKYLQIAMWETNRLETLINRAMNTIMAEDGHIILDVTEINLSALLREIAGTIGALEHNKTIQVLWPPEAENITVNGDSMHLQGVIYNLLDNAIKYGGNQINIRLKQLEGDAILSIEDDGPGIPPAYRKKVFDKFFRIPRGDRHDIKGHGLGLSYARYIIQAHSGQLVLSDQDPGTSFNITLPLFKKNKNELQSAVR